MFAGSLVALVTPMQPDGSIDFDAWSRLLEFHVANGTAGIVVAGSTGESATVTDAELRELLVHARRTLGKRALLIANAGTSSTATSVERARWISELDVDALLVASPSYVRPTQQGSVPALRSDRRELANSRAALQRSEPHGGRPAAGHRGAPVASAAHRRHQGSGGRGRARARARRGVRARTSKC